MLNSQPCARRVLAHGECSMVEQCSCGYVHLTIGGVTLRLVPTVLAALADTINDAARTMVLNDAFAARHHDVSLS